MIKFQRYLMITALVCCFAGEGMAQKKSFWKSIVAYLDSSNVKGVDPAYITQPDKPWAIAEIRGTDSVLISKQKGRKIEHFNN